MRNNKLKIVINEWILHDLSMENGLENFQKVIEMFENMHLYNFLFVVGKGTRWMDKFTKLYGTTRYNHLCRKAFETLFVLLYNSDYFLILDKKKFNRIKLKIDVPRKDRYLIKLYYAVNADLLVCKDDPLINVLKATDINAISKCSFFSRYINPP